jgi:hypothetical protein
MHYRQQWKINLRRERRNGKLHRAIDAISAKERRNEKIPELPLIDSW